MVEPNRASTFNHATRRLPDGSNNRNEWVSSRE